MRLLGSHLGDSSEQVLDEERREPLAFEDKALLLPVEGGITLVITSITT